nr:thermonuclease family protein [Haemophilus paracuniculus]
MAVERELSCKVVGISDGDTLTCLKDKAQIKVRLVHIDAPELAQPFGQRAKQALASLAFKKQVTLAVTGYDKYQRMLAVVYESGDNLNLKLVEQGMAWAYRQTQPIYQQAQANAQAQRVGLWRDPNPVDPAEWRKLKRDQMENRQVTNTQPTSANLNCQVKRSCRQMADYEQAVRYFKICGWQELDGNGDGIPCNKLYRKAQQR